MVAVEVPEPDHRICGGGKDKGEVGGQEGCEQGGGLIVGAVIVYIEEQKMA